MSLNFDIIGVPGKRVRKSWSSTDSLLYDLAVGAGRDPRFDELAFVTENSSGVEQQVLPSFLVLIAHPGSRPDIGDINPAMLVHAEQGFELHQPLSVAGEVDVVQTVTGMYDKGSGALITSESVATDPATGLIVGTTQSSVFIRGEGGFGGDAAPADEWEAPSGTPDFEDFAQTRPDQALLYRLTGDRNPLHSDPKFAARAGFDQPILHGMCTYGETGRMLLHGFGESDPGRVRGMSARFSRPVMPGQKIHIRGWRIDDTHIRFQSFLDDGTVVIDRGRLELTSDDQKVRTS